MRGKRWIALGAAALLLTGCGLLPPEAEETVIEVSTPVVTQREVTTVKRGSVESRLQLNVSFGAEQQQSLYFLTSGRLAGLHVSMGQKVAAGALLAELEADTLPLDLESAELDLEKTQIKIEEAKARIGFTDGPSETDLKNYDLELRQAELKLRRLQDQLADTRLFAPFAGQVVQVSMVVGDQISSYAGVVTLAAEGKVVARAPVDETQLAQLTPGMAVDLFPNDSNPTPISGKILSVPVVGTAAEHRVVIIAPDEPSNRLAVGRNGRVEVVLQRQENALLVPLSAIRAYNGRSFVTVESGGTRQEVAIEVGLMGDQYAEVLSGLNEGDRVVSR